MDLIRPEDYATWRAGTLGAITEQIEQELCFRLASSLEVRRVLDVGCGDGAYALASAQRGARVTAVDASSGMIAQASRRAQAHGVRIGPSVADAAALPFGDDRFDVVFAITVLCFVSDPGAALKEMARVLAPGGRLVLGELGRWSLWAAWRRVRGWTGSRRWRLAKFRSARELRLMVTDAGLLFERHEGAVFFPPLAVAARFLRWADPWLGAVTTFGAAFLGVTAVKPAAADSPSGRERAR